MKVLGIAGSNSSKSINKRLVKHVAEKYFTSQEIEILDLNNYEVPIFSIDREDASGIPAPITALAAKISGADLIILSLAENNASYSVAFKNVYDWLSRIADRKVFDGRPLLLMATSPGGRGGQSVLAAAEDRFPRDGAEILGTFSLPSFYDNLPEGAVEIVDSELRKQLKEVLDSVKTKS